MKEKPCSNPKCTQNNPQPINSFYKNSNSKDGLRYWCKTCDNINSKRWQKKNPEKFSNMKKKYEIKNPWKLTAKQAIAYAIKTGKIIPQSCIMCGDPKSEGHHPDYSQPYKVIWLCREHHRELHKTI